MVFSNALLHISQWSFWLARFWLQINPDPSEPTSSDPLVADEMAKMTQVGGLLLLIALTITVGVFSRRMKYAVFFAIALSLVLILTIL